MARRFLAMAVSLGCTSGVTAGVFQNTGVITVQTVGPADPYPSAITVFGLASSTTSVRVRLDAVYHGRPDDMDVLLVGPTGAAALLMSDVGGVDQVTNIFLVFEDGAPTMPDNGPLAGGTYAPTDFEPGDMFPAPAPSGPYGTSLSVFNGLDPNGEWRLFVVDDLTGKSGRIGGGWALEISAVPSPGFGGLAGVLLLARAHRRRRGR